MTEADWLACADPKPMLDYIDGRTSERRIRLFGCACVRRVWNQLTDEQERQVVVKAEQYADGTCSLRTLRRHTEKLNWSVGDCAHETTTFRSAAWLVGGFTGQVVTGCISSASRHILSALGYSQASIVRDHLGRILRVPRYDREEVMAQATILRCIFGNPFRTSLLDANWIHGDNSVVRTLAQSIYEERTFNCLPLLADALENVGCGNVDILAHCRSPGPHGGHEQLCD